jgi:hypothetical protein
MGLFKSPEDPGYEPPQLPVDHYKLAIMEALEAGVLDERAPFIPYGSSLDQVVQDIVEGRRKP